ncbi:MAG: hypothetical protein A2Z21_08035 [Candidatus Fraserbacteria bacterium RBG_16_55_9]|uniref:CARDB domain-containing protein n=1 Tax=Fraserbacteria sp. (strain RBG_16_55_9) TaxID=1817864 RepID=A0A1F5UNP3_FRAXR|nr:MAG: hypothetical protein A2Z21_08035 [Candidatus Fraserbacteria bacterium RBG_16_55_9]
MNRTNDWVNRALCSSLVSIVLILGFAGGMNVSVAAQANRAPDLVVERLVLDPLEPEPGVGVELKATVTNKGQARVIIGFSVYFEADDKFLSSKQISRHLDPGKQSDVKILWTAAEGEHTLRVRVDAFDDVVESNETNNTLETRVDVRRLEGIRSITMGLLENIGQGLQKTGQALQIQSSNDVAQLLNAFQVSLGTARQELSTSADRISILGQILSSNLAGEGQVQSSNQVAKVYRSTAAALDNAIQGIQRLNPQLLTDAFVQVRMSLVDLSALSIEGISLSGISETVPLMDQGLEKAEQLQAALGGAKNVDVNAVAQDLLTLLSQIGVQLIHVGDGVIQTGQERAAHFSDSKGQPVSHYQSGQELKVSASDANHLKLEVFDATGKPVFTSEAEGSQLNWNGTGGDSRALLPGRYFYRLTITASGSARVELGEIVVSP